MVFCFSFNHIRHFTGIHTGSSGEQETESAQKTKRNDSWTVEEPEETVTFCLLVCEIRLVQICGCQPELCLCVRGVALKCWVLLHQSFFSSEFLYLIRAITKG